VSDKKAEKSERKKARSEAAPPDEDDGVVSNGAAAPAVRPSLDLDDPPRAPLAPGVKYRRILLKLSGEALMGAQQYGIDPATLAQIADEIIDVHSLGVEIALVIGGGNIFRGFAASSRGMDRAHADYMTRWSRAARARVCCRRSRWSAWPSPTSGAAPSATSRRGGW